MIAVSHEIAVSTSGAGTHEITAEVKSAVDASGVQNGLAVVFVAHTSASLLIFENADPSARADLQGYFDRIAPEGEPWFTHTLEGRDDMPAHLKMALTRTSETIPVVGGRLALGTWQGIFLFEHRRTPHTRRIVVSVMGR